MEVLAAALCTVQDERAGRETKHDFSALVGYFDFWQEGVARKLDTTWEPWWLFARRVLGVADE